LILGIVIFSVLCPIFYEKTPEYHRFLQNLYI
jgi:hypothetical protein